MRTRRALLFMPGDSRSKIEKGSRLAVDSIIMDLEDGVAVSQKSAARETAAAALREVDFGRAERIVRVNPVSSPFHDDDLTAILPARPDTIFIPKVESAEQVRAVSERIAAAETAHGWPPGSIALIALIETARGVVFLREIAASDPRLVALAFGAEDLAGDMGAVRTPEGWEGFYARSAVVLHAKAFGLQALDTPFVRLDDEDGLRRETRLALQLGYDGKLAIHPKQIEPIHQTLMPSEEEIGAAQRLLDAYRQHQASGAGVFSWENRMIDMPMIRAARHVLMRAGVTDTGDPD